MKLIDRQSGTKVTATIEEVVAKELIDLNQDSRFQFNWILEKQYDVYKIFLVDHQKVVGLLSLMDVPKEFRIEIRLLEVAIENVGKEKELRNIAGCLIAFACSLAFKRNYDGFVSLIPKTNLIQHYQNKYGFQPFGSQLAIHTTQSALLIQKYLENDR